MIEKYNWLELFINMYQEFVRCYDRENTFIGIAKYDKTNNFYLPHKIFLQVVE